ncbi:glycosyltransferase [Vicingaceae bacterium]|jgi:glycosyltransferase involved in cell wall biosynthesis|nr:glycosyltransferase [Vicingaceae bacterium]
MDINQLIKFLEFNTWLDYLIAIYLGSFVVQLFYYGFFFSRLAFFKAREVDAEPIPVSVIICAKNERDNLLEFLPDYLTQDYPKFEVIVVNDNSVDDTNDVLRAFALQYKALKIVNVPDTDRFYGSKKFALTLGIKAAQYDHVLLTDADCKPSSPNWVKLMSQYAKKKGIVLGVGVYERKKGMLNKLIRFETFYTALQYLSFAQAKIPYMGVGRNLGYQSQLFFKNKGFASHNHILSGDDDLFINEIADKRNTQIIIDSEAHTISNANTTYKGWFRQKKRHFSTGTHYKFKHKVMLGMLQFSQMIFIGLFIALMIMVKPFYLILGVFVLRYLVQMLVFGLSANKIGGKDLIILSPLYEIFFMIFNPILVISNQIVKKTRWN